jgi:hypothetical protein
MTASLSQLLEDSFQVAWEYLERKGELGDGAVASRFLSDTIETMIRQGQRSRLALSNRAMARLSAFSNIRRSGIQAGGALVRLTTHGAPISPSRSQNQESRNVCNRRRFG